MKAASAQKFTLWQDIGLLVGRVLMGWIFVESGWRKITGMDAFIASLVNRRVPYATMMGWIGAPVELFGGLALVLGVCDALRRTAGDRVHHCGDTDRPPLLGSDRRGGATDATKPFCEEPHDHRRPGAAVRHRRWPFFDRRVARAEEMRLGHVREPGRLPSSKPRAPAPHHPHIG